MPQKALAERAAASVLRDDTYRPFADNAQTQSLVYGIGGKNRFSKLLAAPGPDADLSEKFYSNPRREADEIERFMPRVAVDEADSAARIDPAFESC